MPQISPQENLACSGLYLRQIYGMTEKQINSKAGRTTLGCSRETYILQICKNYKYEK